MAEERPLFSVIMANYNNGRFIAEAIQSVINQTYQNWELIIVDDGSTDNSIGVVDYFIFDKRIKLLKNKKNLGCGAAKHRAVTCAKGSIIGILDADDCLNKEAIAKTVDVYEKNNADVVYTNFFLCDDKMQTCLRCEWVSGLSQKETNLKKLVASHFFTFKNDVYLKTQGINQCLASAVDRDLILKLEEVANFYYLDEPLYYYRRHQGGISQGQAALNASFNQLLANLSAYKRRLAIASTANLKEYEIVESMLEQFYENWRQCKFKKAFKIYLLLFDRQAFTLKKIIKSAVKFPLVVFFIFCLSLISRFWPRPHNLVCFFPVYHIGGAEKVHADIINCLSSAKPVIFFTEHSRDDTFKSEFAKYGRVINLYGLPYLNHFCFFVIKKTVINFLNQFDDLRILVSNSPFFYYSFSELKYNFHLVDIIHAFGGGIENISLPHVSKINNRIIITPATLSLLKKQYSDNHISGDYLERVKLIENRIIAPEKFYQKKGNDLKILFVGRNSPEKRVSILLSAYQQIYQNNKAITLSLIGSNFENLPQSLRKICKLIGPVKNHSRMADYYQLADIIVITSSSEGFPLVIMEAMSYGVIPIATAVGGIPLHIRTDVNGILLTAENEDELVDELVQAIFYLYNNPDQRRRLSRGSYDYARANFQNPNFCPAYKNILKL